MVPRSTQNARSSSDFSSATTITLSSAASWQKSFIFAVRNATWGHARYFFGICTPRGHGGGNIARGNEIDSNSSLINESRHNVFQQHMEGFLMVRVRIA